MVVAVRRFTSVCNDIINEDQLVNTHKKMASDYNYGDRDVPAGTPANSSRTLRNTRDRARRRQESQEEHESRLQSRHLACQQEFIQYAM